jgi:hypothetical protein
MDTYQPIFDAVRSRISGGDIGEIVADAVRGAFNLSHVVAMVQEECQRVACEQQRPFVLLKPRMFPDGDQWCALYGENLQDGVAGFGSSPARASYAFDKAWEAHLGV